MLFFEVTLLLLLVSLAPFLPLSVATTTYLQLIELAIGRVILPVIILFHYFFIVLSMIVFFLIGGGVPAIAFADVALRVIKRMRSLILGQIIPVKVGGSTPLKFLIIVIILLDILFFYFKGLSRLLLFFILLFLRGILIIIIGEIEFLDFLFVRNELDPRLKVPHNVLIVQPAQNLDLPLDARILLLILSVEPHLFDSIDCFIDAVSGSKDSAGAALSNFVNLLEVLLVPRESQGRRCC